MLEKIRDILRKPYRSLDTLGRRLLDSIFYGFFVFAFLLIFQPFGIGGLSGDIFMITLGYGSVTTISMFLLNILVPLLIPGFFKEAKWNVAREIFWSVINILSIGLFNTFYTYILGFIELNLEVLFMFEFYTLAVAFFPILISILIQQSKLEKKYSSLSNDLNNRISKNKLPVKSDIIVIKSDNKNENLTIKENQLLFIKSSDNYVEVIYSSENIFKSSLLRNTLKSIENDFKDYDTIFRCHKSYIVNLENVKRISGNAQGYKLHFANADYTVPVSRKFNDSIKNKLTI